MATPPTPARPDLCPSPVLDHGAEFGAHRVHEDGKWDSEFKQHLERHGIKPILARLSILRQMES
jgi:putative transposase